MTINMTFWTFMAIWVIAVFIIEIVKYISETIIEVKRAKYQVKKPVNETEVSVGVIGSSEPMEAQRTPRPEIITTKELVKLALVQLDEDWDTKPDIETNPLLKNYYTNIEKTILRVKNGTSKNKEEDVKAIKNYLYLYGEEDKND